MNNIEHAIEERIVKYKTEYKFEVKDRKVTIDELRQSIEHTLLKPIATVEEISKLCDEAIKYGFYGVCVNPSFVKHAVDRLSGSKVKVVSVVGFPLGATTQFIKARETAELVQLGADEIDMVIHVGMLKSKEWTYVYEDIRSVVEAAQSKPVKVIIETCYLSDEEKIAACVLSELAGAQFVKTSTGFGTAGATTQDVHLLKWCSDKLLVKASGGIKGFSQAVELIKAGASRIGTSSSIKILSEGVEG
ncbi:MAG TPA: deoxyribose-phosphate aldolase [Pseudothermotoga sp.]|nr:deoxyribose-phosphate aldolase [Pseudothermotoga sp.]HPP69699.1 deoxyribose-phosphate aldolase [Pseudothermotoga sp.]